MQDVNVRQKAEVNGQEKMDRSVWANTTPSTVNDAYGKRFHPFAKSGEFKDSEPLTPSLLGE